LQLQLVLSLVEEQQPFVFLLMVLVLRVLVMAQQPLLAEVVQVVAWLQLLPLLAWLVLVQLQLPLLSCPFVQTFAAQPQLYLFLHLLGVVDREPI
jgi:hypothetical protein